MPSPQINQADAMSEDELIEQARQLGCDDALQIRSEAVAAGTYKKDRSGGWYETLVEMIGVDEVAELFGCESCTDLFRKCCVAYDNGATIGWNANMPSKQINLRLPAPLRAAVQADAAKHEVTIQFLVISILSYHYGVEFVEPKRGGDQRSEKRRKENERGKK